MVTAEKVLDDSGIPIPGIAEMKELEYLRQEGRYSYFKLPKEELARVDAYNYILILAIGHIPKGTPTPTVQKLVVNTFSVRLNPKGDTARVSYAGGEFACVFGESGTNYSVSSGSAITERTTIDDEILLELPTGTADVRAYVIFEKG